MDERFNRLKNLDNQKLLDVIKNYQRYNYPETFKEEALKILESRGFGIDAIKLSGGYSNHNYTEAGQIFNKFKKNGTIALILYVLSLLSYFSEAGLAYLILTILFLLFIILTMNNRKDFFKTIEQEESDRSLLGYFLIFMISIPFYFVVYIIDKNELKGKLENLP